MIDNEEDERTELDMVYDDLAQARLDHKYDVEQHTKRILELTCALEEALEYIKNDYDVVDGDYGEEAPNKAMRLGQMIDETLYGIRF